MYIPQTNHHDPNPLASTTTLRDGLTCAHDFIRCHNSLLSIESIPLLVRRLFTDSLSLFSATLDPTSRLGKRSGADINTTIGVVVGVLLAVFLIGAGVFLYFYGRSIRFTKKRHRHRKSSASRSTKNSEGTAGAGGDPPAA
ncbi:uncharacterized protein F4822DRAFT_2253 [Hypoxylon trugodes]|uniref:uncharacterized protein n=1 Tax=Hypoxylon trugodes TaxID=326681 RepID=UPI00219F4836|nr:uncharacterized protein F4822DRAFT_2253 [Hypoxylon trugodes]KAI1393164.1 hypothetical protein F4822DRAFT_2253 [Hypoxylon trugodes]